MSTERDVNDPSIPSSAYEVMTPKWELMRTVLGGTESMRAAGETYLPRHDKESDSGYRERLDRAVFFNQTKKTLGTLVGKPFSNDVKIDEKTPDVIKELFDDIDLLGNKLGIFARQWFQEGLSKAFCHVLVDFPRKPGNVVTREDEQNANLRPYWVLIKPENLIAARCEVINGVETLVHARIVETYTVSNGFAEEERTRIRVLDPGQVRLFEPQKDNSNKVTWKEVDSWATSLSVVPLVTFYAQKDGFMLGTPPLEDLAHLNVSHWQSTSDQDNILTVARFPLLACSGVSQQDSDDLVIGPNKILWSRDPAGKYYYVEHTGAAIEAGRKSIQDLEARMATYGAEFLKERPGEQTATAAAIDSAEATSELGAMVLVFADALEQALYYTGMWLGIADQFTGAVELTARWDTVTTTRKENLDTLNSARQRKDISRDSYLREIRLLGVLSKEFDDEANQEELDAEPNASLGMSSRDLNPIGKE